MFLHKDMHRLSLEFCAVVAHGNTDHKEGEFVIGGKKSHACSIYDLPNCKAHEDMRAELAKRNLLEGVRGTPTHIFYNPHDLSELGRAHFMTRGDFERSIEEHQRVLGKPVRWKDFEKARGTLDEAKALAGDREFRKALRALEGFDALGMEGLGKEAADLEASILEAGRALLVEAGALAEAGEREKALRILRDVLKEFPRTALAGEAKTRIAALKE